MSARCGKAYSSGVARLWIVALSGARKERLLARLRDLHRELSLDGPDRFLLARAPAPGSRRFVVGRCLGGHHLETRPPGRPPAPGLALRSGRRFRGFRDGLGGGL